MKNKISILGSTGSIGNTVFRLLKEKKSYDFYILSGNKNIKKINYQIKNYKPKYFIIFDDSTYLKLKKKIRSKKTKILSADEFLNHQFKRSHVTVAAIPGIAGLEPTLNIIKHSKTILIANKESVVCGWNLIKNKANKYNTKILPIDSEHFSIMHLLESTKTKEIEKIYLTASGGPFLNYSKKMILKAKPSEAIKHPTWKMGKKISIDSATLVNKLFEVIEAQRLFNIDIDKISIKIHPKSYIHSIIKFRNGLIKICAHGPNMSIPIANSLDKNFNHVNKIKTNFKILNNLNFTQVDKKKFPVIKILKKYPNYCTLFDTALVSINDELVNLFLNKKISFDDIFKNLTYILNLNSIKKLKKIVPKNYKEISDINDIVRLKTLKLSVC